MKDLLISVDAFFRRFLVVALILGGATFLLRETSLSEKQSFIQSFVSLSLSCFPFSIYALWCLWKIIWLIYNKCHNTYLWWQYERSLDKVVKGLKEIEELKKMEKNELVRPFILTVIQGEINALKNL